MTYRVAVEGLNLRSRPEVRPGTVLAVLRYGDNVHRLSDAGQGWWQVATTVDGTELAGFVASRFLSSEETFGGRHEVRGPAPEAHLPTDRTKGHRMKAHSWAYPLDEPGQPRRDPEGSAAERRDALTAIVQWLDVEVSARYQPSGGATYCNVYVHDYCHLASAYLPRVWWKAEAAADLGRGEAVAPVYGRTVRELSANSQYEWLRDHGNEFGWRRVFDLTELQDAANEGGVAVISARRRDRNRSGHIAAVVPEVPGHAAERAGGKVTQPLQSQAGARNYRYRTYNWWWSSRFDAYGYWVNTGN